MSLTLLDTENPGEEALGLTIREISGRYLQVRDLNFFRVGAPYRGILTTTGNDCSFP
jgi:hypothetical protein